MKEQLEQQQRQGKTYIGFRTSTNRVFVYVEDGKTGARRPLGHVQRHSEDLEWGYGGAGPADLALSILVDVAPRREAEAFYQDFKRCFVADWPADSVPLRQGLGEQWRLGEAEIRDWLSVMLAGQGGEYELEALCAG